METQHPLATLEPRLRWLLPADLYVAAWFTPSPDTLTRVFGHLRTLRHILFDYLPRQISENPTVPGTTTYAWQEGTLMFTDLAGFTPLLEANAAHGRAGAETLLGVLNDYFTTMIEIISKSGGTLLEFTGDAMLAQFSSDHPSNTMAQAVRASLRMQRAMERFASIETAQENLSLGMRIGLHSGRFLVADIGTPRRMERVLFGNTVLHTKVAEGRGVVGRVNLTQTASDQVQALFQQEPGTQEGFSLIVDDLTDQQLGEYDINPPRHRLASSLLLERSVEGLVGELTQALDMLEPLAAYLPIDILSLLVESASRRRIIPQFPELSILFVNLIGLPESVDYAYPEEEGESIGNISRIFGLINAVVEARGGVLKNVTYHHTGSDTLIYFGVPNNHADDPLRAVDTAMTIRQIVHDFPRPTIGGRKVDMYCQIGIARGPAFAAEIGEPRGRREFNILGDTVNVAARLMSRAGRDQILLSETAYTPAVAERFDCESLGMISLKGKAVSAPIFTLHGYREE